MDQSLLTKVVLDQKKTFAGKERGITRDVNHDKYLKTKQITVVSGIRRSGKSTLLKQFSENYERFYYLNFDDERLVDFDIEDFQSLMVVFKKLYPAKAIFLDEIQNVPRWERFVRRVYEEGYKIFITGSNASLLGSELATHLTGRYFRMELYPFSFKEYLLLKGTRYENMSTQIEAEILKNFSRYLKGGGFPEFLVYKKREFVERIYEDVIYKDLLVRFKIKETKSFKQLASYLFSNFTKEISYHSLKNFLGFKSVTSVRNYIDFMQDSYLIFELFKYDYSLKKQYTSNKKVYVVDNGMRNAVSFYASGDFGRLLENLVFVELKRRGEDVFYFREGKECDFILRKGMKITEAIQVASRLDDPKTKKREIEGLLEALKKFKLKKGLIITENSEGEVKTKNKQIIIIPAWKWLLAKQIAR